MGQCVEGKCFSRYTSSQKFLKPPFTFIKTLQYQILYGNMYSSTGKTMEQDRTD
jgi:hypothetical protein